MESPLKLGFTRSSGTCGRPSVHILRISEFSRRIVTRPGENRYSCPTGPIFAGVPFGRQSPLLLRGILSLPLSPRTAAMRSSRIAAYLGFSGTSAPNTKLAPPGAPAEPRDAADGRLGAQTPDQSGNRLIESQLWPRTAACGTADARPAGQVAASNPQAATTTAVLRRSTTPDPHITPVILAPSRLHQEYRGRTGAGIRFYRYMLSA